MTDETTTTIEDAAKALHKMLPKDIIKRIHAIGVNETDTIIVVYGKKGVSKSIPAVFKGFSVEIRQVDEINPAEK